MNPTTAAAWAEKALSGAMIPGGVGMVNEYRARVGRAIESYARQQMVVALKEAAEHFRYCDLAGTELEHRCEQCMVANLLVVAARKAP